MYSDQYIRRVLTHHYVKFIGSRSEYRGGPWVNGLNIAFTQSVDARQCYACKLPVANSADVARFFDAADLEQLGLRSVNRYDWGRIISERNQLLPCEHGRVSADQEIGTLRKMILFPSFRTNASALPINSRLSLTSRISPHSPGGREGRKRSP